MAGESILVVDDNPANSKLVAFILSNRGYDVRTAANATEALDAIAARSPELILMDIQLPETDGLTLTRQLRDDPRTRDVVIIAVTAYAMKGDDRAAYAAGCDGYITKPIDTRALSVTVAEHLARRRAQRQAGA